MLLESLSHWVLYTWSMDFEASKIPQPFELYVWIMHLYKREAVCLSKTLKMASTVCTGGMYYDFSYSFTLSVIS